MVFFHEVFIHFSKFDRRAEIGKSKWMGTPLHRLIKPIPLPSVAVSRCAPNNDLTEFSLDAPGAHCLTATRSRVAEIMSIKKEHLREMTLKVTNGFCRFSVLLSFLLILEILAISSYAKENAVHSSHDAETADLTGLSLSELYNLEVVQPNVLGGHTHPEGQIMFGYDYMHTSMSGIYDGSREISASEAFAQGFSTVHTEMEMDMHMFELMYAPTDRLTLMAMLPYHTMSMKHLSDTGHSFNQSAEGIGDFELMGLFTILGDIRTGGHRLILNAGMSFPTGSINVKDHSGGNKNNPEVILEYFMQLGSGTYDLLPGLTYLGDSGPWSWGAQTIETIRLGRNKQGYRFGNEYRLSTWLSYGVTDWFAPSIRLDGRLWEDIIGSDPRLVGNPTPEGRPDLRAGRRVDLLFGVNFYAPEGFLKGSRLMMEGGFPVYQHLNGPQLGTAWMFSLGLSYAF